MDFASYAECDDYFVKRALQEKFPGLTPIWATDELGNVSTNFTFGSNIDG